MAYRITDDCISCGDCCVVCPHDAIDDGYGNALSQEVKGEDHWVYRGFRITDRCNECGRCAEVCPIGAIVKE